MQPAYRPNRIPLWTRIWYVLASGGLLVYATVGLWIDDIYLPGRRQPGLHLHGEPAWLMYAAMVTSASNLLAIVIDHYDTRDNEANYRAFAKVSQYAGCILAVGAVALDLLVLHKGTR